MSDDKGNTGNLNTGDLNTGGSNTGNLNTGNRNTGNSNTGHWNTGDSNTGRWNTGDSNTGNLNTGDLNTGGLNTGNLNTGDSNTGDWNTGDLNTGDSNTGHWNTGDWNTGDWNTGNWNTGNRNTGDWNTGDWNTGNRNTGYFCVESPTVTFFDLPVEGISHNDARGMIPLVDLPIACEWIPREEMSDGEKLENTNFETVGGYLKKVDIPIQEAFPKAWERMSKEDRQRWLNLPNFDAEKFLKCTGVDVRKDAPVNEPQKEPQKEIELNGLRYRLIEDPKTAT